MKYIFTCLIISLSASFSWGQIAIQNTLTPVEIVENVLLGTGVTVSNIEWNGSTVEAAIVKTSLGEFSGTSNVGIPSGVILSCGNVAEAVGPNSEMGSSDNTGVDDYTADADLQGLQPAGVNIHDAGVIEFDFVPSGDTISFQYVFASEEYPEYAPPVSSGFNDAFGFFLTGPNPAGGAYAAENIAVLPGTTTPVSINNINPVTNVAFYVDNAGGTTIEYDGLTTVLTATAAVECGQTYHIKLGISDAGDNAWNSAVFLEANSFSSNAIQVSIVTQTGDTSIIEGCANAEIFFVRPESDTASTLVVDFTIAGTAINGTDYSLLGSSVTFLPGEDSVSLIFNPLTDAIVEGPESVIITVYTVNPCGDTISSTGTLWILEPHAEVTVNSATFPCPNGDGVWLVATPTAGVQEYTYSWTGGSTNDSLFVPTSSIGTINYTITMTDFCGEVATAIGTVIVQEYNAASFVADPTTGEGPLTVNYTNTSSPSGTSYVWDFGNGQTETTATPTNVSSVFTGTGDYTTTLTVTSPEGCVDITSELITVYELPTVSAPNVFTPNGDDLNEAFAFFDVQNIDKFECFIINRWGNLMYEMDNVADTWDGTVNGTYAEDGIYFYSYTGSSLSGQETSGHGFFHLIRVKN